MNSKKAWRAMDNPDRQVGLFIRLCLQNNGRLSENKRASRFEFLSDEEIAAGDKLFNLYGIGHDWTPDL
jgi:hypothetical protein